MMIRLRKAHQRGHSQTDWLNSFHTFSFGDYYDEQCMNFGSLRVINDDIIQPERGFGMHSHHDMEIITYVIRGELSHHDSLGNGSIIRPGEIQRMSAGTGVRHSEFNHSATQPLHLLQIWITPEQKGISPGYEQKQIEHRPNHFVLIGAPQGHEHCVKIHQRMHVYTASLDPAHTLTHSLEGRNSWLHVIEGCIQLHEQVLNPGDGIAIEDEKGIMIQATQHAHLLLFEMF